MESRVISSCPPMTLREREVLNAIQIGFLIPPLPRIFHVNATQVLTRALLENFINNLLSTIHGNKSLIEIPRAKNWGLKGNEDEFINLASWNPRRTRQDVYKVVALPSTKVPEIPTPTRPQGAIVGSESSPSKSIELPSQGIFEIHGSHLVIVIHFRVKTNASKKKPKYEETKKIMLIPADLKVVNLVNAFRDVGNVNGIFKLPDTSNMVSPTVTQTATELGWRHGTELVFDM